MQCRKAHIRLSVHAFTNQFQYTVLRLALGADTLDAFNFSFNNRENGLHVQCRSDESLCAADTSAAGQDRYLGSLGALAGQLASVPAPARWNDSGQGEVAGSAEIGVNPGGEAFTVLHWRLSPRARVRPHAHTYGNVVTLGLEGVARVQNFELAGARRRTPDFETTGTFTVRQTVDQVLVPGSINLVSLARNYIHGMQAGPSGARGLDITTRLAPRPEYGTPYLVLGEGPIDPAERTFEARWQHE